MRALVVLAAFAGCGEGGDWLVEAHVLVDGFNETNLDCRTGPCVHNENTDLAIYGDVLWLVHRTAESQILGPNSSLRVYRSADRGASWAHVAVIPAPVDRDLRDPHFFVLADGRFAIKALTRLPVLSTRDSDVDTIAVLTTSADGTTWSALQPIAPATWSLWRVIDVGGTKYSAAYEDGDKRVVLFSSVDGVAWTPGATIYDVVADTPLETELVATGGELLALVRMDGLDNELLGSEGRLRTKVCRAAPPFTAFSCPSELDGVRLDGPVALQHAGRLFVIARKHILGVANKKRTALYELAGEPLDWIEHGEFPSAGDTSYAGIAPIEGDRFVVSYYASNLAQDGPWARAMFGPTDIWQATIDLARL